MIPFTLGNCLSLLVVIALIPGCGAEDDGGGGYEIDVENKVSTYVEAQTEQQVAQISCQPEGEGADCEVILRDGGSIRCGASGEDEHVEVTCIN